MGEGQAITIIETLGNEDVKNMFQRKTHEIFYGKHYNEQFAKDDIAELHWNCNDIKRITFGLNFPPEVTEYDKLVAMNVMYSSLHGLVDEKEIVKIAYKFFFDDEEWPDKDCKVWEYVNAKLMYGVT